MIEGCLGSVHLQHTKGAGVLWSLENFENYYSDSLQYQDAHWIFFFCSILQYCGYTSVSLGVMFTFGKNRLRSYPPYLHCLSGTYAQARTPSNHH